MLTVRVVPSALTDMLAADMLVSWLPSLLKNHTSVAPPRFAPVIVTVVAAPLLKVAGLTLEITGPVVTEMAWLGSNSVMARPLLIETAGLAAYSVIGRPLLTETPLEKTVPRLLGCLTLTWAWPNRVGCKMLVAHMVTLVIGREGAVYSPAVLIVPTELFPPTTPFTLQVTPVSPGTVSMTLNCWFWLMRTSALDGMTCTPDRTVNGALVSVPLAVTIVTGPVVAVPGTIAVTEFGVTLAIWAEAPLNDTLLTPALKPLPKKATGVPTAPDDGLNP
jgi:hypothetical protein